MMTSWETTAQNILSSSSSNFYWVRTEHISFKTVKHNRCREELRAENRKRNTGWAKEDEPLKNLL